MDIEDFKVRLEGVRGKSARCPAHHDQHNSLSFDVGEGGGILVHCHAGCQTESIVESLGLTMRDLSGLPHIVAEYPYYTEAGDLLWTVERWACPKTFRCRPGLPSAAQRVLYRADALAWARDRAATVYITEGEKDADRLGGLGLVSTTNVGGAGSWLPHYAEQVAGTHVVVIADNDDAGRQHARAVAKACDNTALSVRTVVPRYGKDLSEMLDLGWTLDTLDPLPTVEGFGIVLAANVIERPVEWAWAGYIPLGAVTICEGDPGDGKSFMSCDLAARWSSGAPMPDGTSHGGPYRVVFVNAEDSVERTVVPRLRGAGGDLNRIELVTYGTELSRPFSFGRDLPDLALHMIENGVKILVCDPLMALLDDKVDAHSDHSVRRALWPLHRLAEDTGAAILIIRHLNKGQGLKAAYRGGGSIGIGGAARAVYAVGRDPESPATRRVLASVKMNIAPTPPSLAFSVDNSDGRPFIDWHGQVDANAQEVIDGLARGEEDQDIVYFLNTIVSDDPMKWSDIVRRGKAEGYTEAQLRHRRPRSRLVKIYGSEGNRSVTWGYAQHQLLHSPGDASRNPHFPELPPPASQKPQIHLPKVGGSDGKCPDDQHLGKMNMAQVAGNWQGPEQVEEADPDSELDSRPLVCEVCQTEDKVSRFGSPWWVIRCVNHNPITYHGGA